MTTNTPKRRLIIAASGLVLLVLAYFAAAGILDWLNRPADEAEAAALAEQAERNSQLLQDQISEQLTSGPISEEQERLDLPIGQALMQQCLEWTDFHENHPSESTLKNRDASCGEFNEYISSGKVPE